jgi:hypothetical protein
LAGEARSGRDHVGVEFLVDIDQAAAVFDVRRLAWEADGIAVDGPTWGDDAALWPDKLFIDRAWVVRPFSWGIRLRRGSVEASLVLFTAGWVDLQIAHLDVLNEFHPEYVAVPDVQAFADLLDATHDRIVGA